MGGGLVVGCIVKFAIRVSQWANLDAADIESLPCMLWGVEP